MDNNTNNENAYAKAGFNIYYIANANIDLNIDASNTSTISEKVNNNLKNINA